MASAHEEEVLGKAYDSRLMKRLLRYLAPYKWQVAIALGSIFLKVGADVLGPYLTKIVIDRYLAPVPGLHTRFDRFLSSIPFEGIDQFPPLIVGLLASGFFLDFFKLNSFRWPGRL